MNPKIFLGVSLIISLSIIIGVVLVVGILLWNNLLTITPTFTESTVPIKQQVTIITDKVEYEQGETVKVTIKNNLNQSVDVVYQIDKITEEKIIPVRVRSQECPPKELLELPVEILPEPLPVNSAKEFLWDQKDICTGIQQTGGTYRVKAGVTVKEYENYIVIGEEKFIISSNEFTIKEKKSISCDNDFDCPIKMKCENHVCVDVGCIEEGHRTPITPISPEGFEQRKHTATECCEGLEAISSPDYFDEDCNFKPKIGVSGGAICSNCGNGICENWENRCNCPEDCK